MFPTTVDPTLYGATLPYKDFPVQTPWAAFPWQTWQNYQKIPPFLTQTPFGQTPFGQVPQTPFGQVPFGQVPPVPFGGMNYQQQLPPFFPQAYNPFLFGTNYNLPYNNVPFHGMQRFLPY